MTETIQTTDLRRHVRAVLDRVRLRREAVIVQSYSTPQAVIIPYEDFEAFRQWQADNASRQAWLAELRAIAKEVSARAALSDEEVESLVEEASRG